LKLNGSIKISNISLLFILNISVGFLFFYADQYFHTHFTSNYSYTRPYFRAFYLFDTWSYAILLSLFLLTLAIIEKDRLRAFFAVPILLVTSVFNILFIGVNNGYYFPWNLIATEPNHWLMQWGFNLIVSIQWMLFLIGVLKSRRFASILVPLGAALITLSSLFRNDIQRIFDFGATPIELAYGTVILFSSAFTTAYLIYRKKKQFTPTVVQSTIATVSFFIIGIVAWNAPRIHSAVPVFIFERDMGLGSILLGIMASFFASQLMKKKSFTIKRKHTLAVLVVVILLLPLFGYVQYHGRDNVVVEHIGGKCDARIRVVHFPDGEEFCYIKEGKDFSGYFNTEYTASLDWTMNNTPDDSVFLCWWDYGHMIRAIGEREVVIFSPSEKILWTIQDPNKIREYSVHQHVLDVAQALTTTEPNETISIMKKYDADYIFVSKDDAAKAGVLFKVAGKDSTMYLTPDGFTEEGKKTTLYKILQITSLEHFEMVYNDSNVIIYKLIF